MASGLLAQIPGANPSNGDAAAWFLHTTDVLGVVAMVAAAVLNLFLIRLTLSTARRRRHPEAPRPRPGT